MKAPLVCSALASLLWWGCANPVSWENDIHIPVLDDRVTWADVVPDSLYEPGVEGGPAQGDVYLRSVLGLRRRLHVRSEGQVWGTATEEVEMVI